MKLWIDENIPRPIKKALEQAGHETLTASSESNDLSILQQAHEAAAVIITHDRDFKKYVLGDGWACAGVIWIRPTPRSRREELIAKLLRIIKIHEETLSTSFITLALDQTEIINLK